MIKRCPNCHELFGPWTAACPTCALRGFTARPRVETTIQIVSPDLYRSSVVRPAGQGAGYELLGRVDDGLYVVATPTRAVAR
jgi:hypothetical protein